jgi:hypothetical protein
VLAEIHRKATTDRHGDGTFQLIGTATGVIIGGQSVSRTPTRGEVADTSGQLGFPRSGLIPKHGDRVLCNGMWFEISGPAMWNWDHAITGTNLGYAWVKAESVIN